MTHTSNKIENMYYFEDIYTSEYDGTPGNWEDEYDSIFSLTVVPEPGLWKSFYQHPLALSPVQLAAKSSNFLTMDDAKKFYNEKYEKEFEEAKIMEAVEKENKALETLWKEMEKKKELESTPLPIESDSFKQKREAAEKVLREEAEEFRKKTKEEQQQGNVWGHRRNGGGKKKRRSCKETADEVLQARRALHRKKVKDQKKIEEEARAVKFAVEKTKVVPAPKPVVQLDDDEVEMRKLIIAKLVAKPESVSLPPSPPVSQVSTPPRSPPVSPVSTRSPEPQICMEIEETGWEVVKKKEKKEKEVKPDSRDTAIEILADQSKMRQQLKRTKMCLSVKSGKPCPHGVNCRFAHTAGELSISDCFFGSRCRFVYCKNGVFSNTCSKVCQHRHPEETEDNYFHRTGLPDFRSKKTTPQLETPTMNKENFPTLSLSTPLPSTKWVKPPIITSVPPKPLTVTPPTKFPAPPPPTKFPAPPPPPTKFPAPPPPPTKFSALPQSELEETVIKVPKELALQAMEIAMASGKKLIRIEIV